MTLIDAAYPQSANAILKAIASIGEPLRRIIITHAHPDHAGAAAEISARTGAKVLAHEDDIPFLQGRSMSHTPGFWLCNAVLTAGDYLNILNPPTINDVRALADGDAVGSLHVMHSPGHTPGSITLYAPKEGALFCGDNVCASVSSLHVGLSWFTLDLLTQRKSIARYTSLPARLLLSGHGEAYRGDIARQIGKLI